MKNSIEIQKGKLGFFLVINGYAIKRNFVGDICATHLGIHDANNWIATEWDSIKSLRKFWNGHQSMLLNKTQF